MGLDMYLMARKYVSNWSHQVERHGENEQYHAVIKTFGADNLITSDCPAIKVEFNVMYWRKANAIHSWFVNECGGGVDECQPIYVERSKLVELLELCKQVALQPANASSTLPTQSGFFFGSTEYDEWYMEDIKRTIEGLERVLKEVPDDFDWSFVYQASW